ncbi:MAG: hypothetical protein QOG28_1972, partial [Trebonia sp.]|nr:hypothetical protein [Trebonia sp.]
GEHFECRVSEAAFWAFAAEAAVEASGAPSSLNFLDRRPGSPDRAARQM